MKKKILSLALACAVLLTGGAGSSPLVYASSENVNDAVEAEAEENQDTAADTAADMPETSEDDLENADVRDEEAVLSDVTITGLDVPYETIEWGTSSQTEPRAGAGKREHEIILLLDVSGSMSGKPMTELRKACYNFVDDILAEDPQAGIGIVTFESSVRTYTFGNEYFTSDRNQLRSVIKSLSGLGGTAMNAGLLKADEVLQQYGTADNRFIIQMADGEPNSGASYTQSDARYSGGTFTDPDGKTFSHSGSGYCSAIYNTFTSIKSFYHIYSLGFFHSLSGTGKQFAATFMNDIQNRGYFEVTDADRLTFSFEDIAENINSDMLTFSKSSLALLAGKEETLSVIFSSSYPSSDKSVQWSSSRPDVASVDESGTVRAVGKGTCEIIAEAGGYRITCPVTVLDGFPGLTLTTSITIQQNEHTQAEKNKIVASADATVTYNGQSYQTNKNGNVKIPKASQGEIAISKPGFVTRTVPMSYVKKGRTFILQKESENPVINAVWASGKDVLSEELEVALDSQESMVFSADVNWGKSQRKNLQLVQEASVIDFAESTLSIVLLHENFDVSKDIYLVATDQNDHVTKQKLKLQASSRINGLDGFKFSLGDKIGLTLPSAIPLIGGGEVGLSLDDGVLPVSIAVNDGKIHAAIGLDIKKYSKKTTTDYAEDTTETEEEITNFIKEIKNLKKLPANSKDSLKKALDIKKKYKDALTEKKGSFGVNGNFTVTGYIEAYVNKNGKLKITESGVVVTVSAGASWKGNTVIEVVVVPVPVYWEAAISGELEGAFDMYYSGSGAEYTPGGRLSATLEGKVGGGLGNTNVVTLGGGGKASLSPLAQFYSDRPNYFSLTTCINFYFKFTALGIYEKVWEPDNLSKEWKIDNGANRAGTGEGNESLPEGLYDDAAYEAADLDYILEDSQPVRPAAASDDSITEGYAADRDIFEQNALSQTSPKMVEFDDGTRLAVWRNASSNDINTVKLYYSYFSDSIWSEPAVIYDNGTADMSFDLCASGRNAYLIWQNADTQIETGDTLADLPGVSIRAAIFNSTGSFEDSTVLNTEGKGNTCAVMPIIFGEDGNITAAWAQGANSGWFLADGENTIYTSTLSDEGWSTPRPDIENVRTVTSLDGDIDSQGMVNLAYSLDMDQDLNTADDQEIYLNGAPLTADKMSGTSVQFMDHTLYWMSGGNVCYIDPADSSIRSVLAEGEDLLFRTYSVIGEGEHKAILFSVNNDLRSCIQGSFYQSGANTWGSPITLTNPADPVDITDFSALWADGNTVDLLCNRVAVTGEMNYGDKVSATDPYGQTDLVLMNYGGTDTVSITDNYYDKADIAPDGALPVTLTVTNNDTEPISGIAVQVCDENTLIQEVDIAAQILSGASEDITFNCETADASIGKTLDIQCAPLENRNNVTAGSTASIGLSYENLALENLKWSLKTDGSVSITGDAANLGFSGSGTVTASLHRDTADGPLADKVTLPAIASSDSAQIAFEVPFEEDAVYYVSLETSQSDENDADNTDFVVLKSQTDTTGRTLDSISASIQKSTYTAGSRLDISGLTVTAQYTDQTKADVTAESTIQTSQVNMNKEGVYPITVLYGDKTAEVRITVTGKDSSGTVKKGFRTTVNKLNYTVTSVKDGNRTVTLTGCTDKNSRTDLTVPATIRISKTSYKVTAVKNNAFKGCKKLSKVTIKSGTALIGKQAFANCKSLKTVKLGNSLKQIKAKAFSGCGKLKAITIKSKKLTKIEKNAFKGLPAKAKFKVPASRLKASQRLLSKKSVGYRKGWKITK